MADKLIFRLCVIASVTALTVWVRRGARVSPALRVIRDIVRLVALERGQAHTLLNERRRIAAELHDGALQQMTAALSRLRMAAQLVDGHHPAFQPIADGTQFVQTAIEETRSAIFPLVSRPPSTSGLAARVFRAVQRLEPPPSMSVHLASLPDLSDNPAIEEALGGIIGEALVNAGKHAKARNVWVEVALGDGVVTGVVRDDGVGFNPPRGANLGPARKRLGLRLIRERARLAGGRARISSQPNAGTVVRVSLPLRAPGRAAGARAGRNGAAAPRLGSPKLNIRSSPAR